MEAVKEKVRTLFKGPSDGDPNPATYAQKVCQTEGSARIVAAVAEMIAGDASDRDLALLFLAYGSDLPEVEAEIEASASLRDAYRALLASPATRTRLSALGRLGSLPERFWVQQRADAAVVFHRERDLVALVQVLDASSTLVPALLADDDWLVRWSLASATHSLCSEPEAEALRTRLATDPHPLVAGEAAQQRANIDRRNAEIAALHASGSIQGWTFFTPSPDEGNAPCFAALAAAFLASWPAEKTSYTLDELRAFVVASTSGGRPNVEA